MPKQIRAVNFDRLITLLEPRPGQINPISGATTFAEPIRHPVGAARLALPGDNQLVNDTIVLRDRVLFTVRGQGGGPTMRADAKWEIEEDNRRYRIETIYEAPPMVYSRMRNQYLKIRAARSYG